MFRKTISMLLIVLSAGCVGVFSQTKTPDGSPATSQAAPTPGQATGQPPEPRAPNVPTPAAIAALNEKALAGDVSAQAKLGQMYALGQGVPRNLAEAAKWFRKAAEQGDAPSQLKLGVMYIGGFGVQADLQEALRWYKKAAAQGNVDAMLQLGNLYEHGLQVTMNGREALEWYMKAANKGSIDGALKVGYFYLNGVDNVQHDYEQALKWFRKAAQQGNGEAEFNLGRMYQEGLGVVVSVDEATAWYTKAMQHEFPSAGVALRNLKRK